MLRHAYGVLHAALKQGNCAAEPGVHYVLKTPIRAPHPETMETAYFGTGCFWGAEEVMWKTPGVHTTAVGYQGGHKDRPTYGDICSGATNHAETVKVVYNPSKVSFTDLLKVFWQAHDPTQGNRQGNDSGTQYRSAIYCTDATQLAIAMASKEAYQEALARHDYGPITTEIAKDKAFWYAEDDHQQYLAKPFSRQYCSAQPTGVAMPDALQWLPAELQTRYSPKLNPSEVPASRCAAGKCSI
eukprot:TRINITY_DN6982_c0_g2_i1.p1 TRINITY_DN6982_c0_g2~~TRINITY_DN6982_c0_g2_i1.p1  ORF type:complete len:242 (+),score=71.11 TRINITY_DN6982_c0_g2_i1:603-1328(+)